MMNDKPLSKAQCLELAKLCFEKTFTRSELFGWDYLFMWAMYDHWLDEYWNEP